MKTEVISPKLNTERFCNHNLQKPRYEQELLQDTMGIKHCDRANKQFYINTTSFKGYAATYLWQL